MRLFALLALSALCLATAREWNVTGNVTEHVMPLTPFAGVHGVDVSQPVSGKNTHISSYCAVCVCALVVAVIVIARLHARGGATVRYLQATTLTLHKNY